MLPKDGGQGSMTPNPQFGSCDPAEGTRGQPAGRPRAHGVTHQTQGTHAPQNMPLPGLGGSYSPRPQTHPPPKRDQPGTLQGKGSTANQPGGKCPPPAAQGGHPWVTARRETEARAGDRPEKGASAPDPTCTCRDIAPNDRKSTFLREQAEGGGGLRVNIIILCILRHIS